MEPILSPDEARELIRQHGGIRPAARATGISFGAIRTAANKTANKEVEDEAIDTYERDMSRLKDEVRILRRQLTESRREADTAEQIRENIYEIAGQSPNPPIWNPRELVTGAPGVPMTLWSDWHWNEHVVAHEVGGVNEFNLEIAAARARKLTDKVIGLSIDHMTTPQYPGIIVNLGGDMISGLIHEELRDTNVTYHQPAMLDLQDNVAAALERIADEFGNVFVPCVVGNHGRETLKPRMKGRVFTSYEWNMYCQLIRYFRNDPRIQFFVPNETDAYYKVYGHRFLLTHGDSLGVKGGDGIIGSLGPIMRGAVKVGRSESQIGRDFDTILMGHWHQYITLKGIIVNGTLKGYDEYARLGLRAPYERPTQALWFVHPEHGITAHWGIYLEPQNKSDDQWISWPKQEEAHGG